MLVLQLSIYLHKNLKKKKEGGEGKKVKRGGYLTYALYSFLLRPSLAILCAVAQGEKNCEKEKKKKE